MAYTTINKSTDYFDTKLHNGNATAKTLAYDFEVDMFWTKMRNDAYPHNVFDVVRGNNQRLRTNQTNADGVAGNTVSFGNSSGISLGTDSGNYGTNKTQTDGGSQATYVGWGWKAGGTGSANTDGSINSTVSANTTSGFSIVSYTGTGSQATVGHGLGATPKWIVVKRLQNAEDWAVYHASNGAGTYQSLNTTEAKQTNSNRFNVAPTSSVFTVNTHESVNFAENYIAYCFAEKTGYSKFGSYTGNGSGNGPFVYMGFKPAMIIYKRASDGTNNWSIFDNKRDPHNAIEKQLNPNISDAEGTSSRGDFVSHGFKIRTSSGSVNNSGSTYIYMAFAEAPLVGSNGVTAKAR